MALHVLGLILWVGGMFAAGRVLIDHARGGSGAPAILADLERTFLFRVGHPGMLLVLATGIGMLALNPAYYLSEYWMHAKLAFTALAVAASIVLTSSARRLHEDPGAVGTRALNLWRGLLMAAVTAVLVLVFLKPF